MNKHGLMLSLLFTAAVHANAHAAATKIAMPAEFRHARVFVVPETVDAQRIEFYTDTGGGPNALSRSEAERLGLAISEPVEIDGRKMAFVDFPQFREGKSIPPGEAFFDGKLLVAEDDRLKAPGFLGGRWFAGKVWEFDYPAKSLALLRDWSAPQDMRSVPLGFQVNDAGERTMHFPRITIGIDGEPVDMLLDTGAGITLTENSAPHFGLPAGTVVAGGFITRSTFEKWTKRHADWLVVDAGDQVQGREVPLIRVPEVTIAGYSAGPVWFAQRPDKAFRQWMSSMMDAPIKGAIGGSAFRYFRMIIDYPNARAYFSMP